MILIMRTYVDRNNVEGIWSRWVYDNDNFSYFISLVEQEDIQKWCQG